jgi:hypothetical protein
MLGIAPLRAASANCPLVLPPECIMPEVQHTRMLDPATNLRGTGWDRFDWLHEDPMRPMEPHPVVHSRMQAKDLFEASGERNQTRRECGMFFT